MYPSSLRIRAISAFKLDAGKSTRGCFARTALRIRVSMSAMGSVFILLLPAGLGHAGDFPFERQTAKANPAHLKFPQKRARTTANPAAVAHADLVFQLLIHFGASCCGRHRFSLKFLKKIRLAAQRH